MSDHDPLQGQHGRSRAARVAITVLILALLGAGYVRWSWLESAGATRRLFDAYGVRLLFITVLMHVALSATPFPSELVGLINGALHGFWLGALLSWLGWWLGALLEYSLIRLGLREVESGSLIETASWSKRLRVDHPLFLIVARQLPFGFHAVNVLAAVAGVPPLRMAVCAAISNVPYALVTAAAGAGLMALPTARGVCG